MYNMTVGEDQAIGREYEARAAATAIPILTRSRSCCRVVHFDIDYRRSDTLDRGRDRARVGIEQ